jgi:replicative DNA helicase
MTQKRDYSTILFTPEEIGNQTADYLKWRRENIGLGVKIGLNILDNDDKEARSILPLMPGELMGIVARPGHAKTGFMVRWARERSKYLRAQKIDNRVIVYITLEQSIEELNAFNLAADRRLSITSMAKGQITDEEWKTCLEESIGRRFLPLWNIGYSTITDKKQIRVDMDAICGAMELIKTEHGKVIDLVCVDYLQRLPFDRAESKTVGVSDNVDALKTMALRMKCPVVVGVQARREVDELKEQIPSMDDGQWTSNIEQTCDRVISLVRPCNYRQDGELFGKTTVEGRNQLLITVLKQKLGPANYAKWVSFDPVFNKLDELEGRYNQ